MSDEVVAVVGVVPVEMIVVPEPAVCVDPAFHGSNDANIHEPFAEAVADTE
jgi:hypothetical protein